MEGGHKEGGRREYIRKKEVVRQISTSITQSPEKERAGKEKPA
jgi:hypothetical protein